MIYVSNTYEDMSTQAAGDLLEIVTKLKDPVICTASGDTPRGMYKALIRMIQQNRTDISRWTFLGLDEWIGMNGHDEGSCRYHLDHDLFGPLKVKEDKIIFFNGRGDADEECKRIESFIAKHKQIDVAIVGLGMNGHIGMNEPGTSANSRSHLAEIDTVTQQVGQKYFTSQQTIDKGITLGIATIMEASAIFLLVNGSKKASITRQVIEDEISEKLPASLLRRHPSLYVYLDKEAASMLPVM
ncbi:MAG TPA: glucosamine-6-phosphate deaminase [Chitinophagaceae bacterium]|nr:glucosamine-6-phosphate deaminase [Chitinophagaceae bacterium]